MKKLLLIGLCLLFILGNKPVTETPQETTVPLSEILLYCNTPEFVKNMAENDYMLGLAASGVINDDRHRMLLSMELLINPRNKQCLFQPFKICKRTSLTWRGKNNTK